MKTATIRRNNRSENIWKRPNSIHIHIYVLYKPDFIGFWLECRYPDVNEQKNKREEEWPTNGLEDAHKPNKDGEMGAIAGVHQFRRRRKRLRVVNFYMDFILKNFFRVRMGSFIHWTMVVKCCGDRWLVQIPKNRSTAFSPPHTDTFFDNVLKSDA